MPCLHEALHSIPSHTYASCILFRNISHVIATALSETQKHKGNHTAAKGRPPMCPADASHIPAQEASELHMRRVPTSCTWTAEAEPPAHSLGRSLAQMYSRAPALSPISLSTCTEHCLQHGGLSVLEAPPREPFTGFPPVTHIFPVLFTNNRKVIPSFDQNLTRFWSLLLPDGQSICDPRHRSIKPYHVTHARGSASLIM